MDRNRAFDGRASVDIGRTRKDLEVVLGHIQTAVASEMNGEARAKCAGDKVKGPQVSPFALNRSRR